MTIRKTLEEQLDEMGKYARDLFRLEEFLKWLERMDYRISLWEWVWRLHDKEERK